MIVLCCRTLSGATFSMCSPACAGLATISKRSGLHRTWSFAFRRSDRSTLRASNSTSGRSVRAVDSSFERIQVKVSGFATEFRYAVTCNGRRVPLYSTGGHSSGEPALGEPASREPGEAVGGVRFRARQLSAVLHPTVPVHAPLIFDLIDRWNERSMGRCTYHVGSPDGRAYTARPLNATEAEDRRRQRFQVSGPPPGPIAVPEEETNLIFPMTLDLRFPPPGKQARSEKPGLVS